MAKSVDVFEKRLKGILPMFTREALYSFNIFDLSEMILAIEHAISYTEGYRFLLLCFGSDGSSDKAKAVIKGMEDYLRLVKEVHRFKVNEKKRKAAFLKGDIY